MTTSVSGTVAPGFEPVRAAFADNLDSRGETGGAFAMVREGETLVDIWAGEAGPDGPWQEDTIVLVFSTTKGPTTATIAALEAAGAIDLDRPIADVWPEFAANGKSAITPTDVLTHRSGVVTFDGYEDLVFDPGWWLDLDRVAASLAAAAPQWEPGNGHGYHGATLGLILNEVVRRTADTTIGAAWREQIADPLHLDFWIGLPTEQHHRVAVLADDDSELDPTVAAYLSLFTPEHLQGRAHLLGESGILAVAGLMNRPEIWPAEFPSGGGIGTAAALASFYGALATNSVATIPAASRRRFTAEQVRGPDRVLLIETAHGLGFQLPTPYLSFGPNPGAFGHAGLGGSIAFADPQIGLGVAYVTRQIRFPNLTQPTRSSTLIEALYACID